MTELQRLQTLLKRKNTIMKLKDIVCDDTLCNALGINEWCVNEGDDGNAEINVNSEIKSLVTFLNADNDIKYKSILDEPEENVPLLLMYVGDEGKPYWYVGSYVLDVLRGAGFRIPGGLIPSEPVLWIELSFS